METVCALAVNALRAVIVLPGPPENGHQQL
jgi:hypothetical protein